MVDVFEEVEEQLRSDRYLTLARKGWPYAAGVVAAVLLATLGVWGWNSYHAAESAKASEAYQSAFDAMAKSDGPAADAGFAKVAQGGAGGYKALALMQQAGLRTTQGKTAEALALFDQAAKASSDPLVSDAAALKAAYLQFDAASLPDLESRLAPLAVAGRPYAALAREALAMKRLTTGHAAEARQAFALLSISPDAGEGLQQRAQIAMAEIDAGQAPNLPGLVKAAGALTPAQVQAAKVAALRANQAAAAQAAAERAAQATPGAAPPPPQAGAPE